jgi:hypothetical protein
LSEDGINIKKGNKSSVFSDNSESLSSLQLSTSSSFSSDYSINSENKNDYNKLKYKYKPQHLSLFSTFSDFDETVVLPLHKCLSPENLPFDSSPNLF